MLAKGVKALVGALLEAYCERRVPLHIRDSVALQFRFRGDDVVLFEKRPVFQRPNEWVNCNVARFRHNHSSGTWSLFHRDRNGRWHAYDLIEPSTHFETLLAEVDRDPTGIFWG